MTFARRFLVAVGFASALAFAAAPAVALQTPAKTKAKATAKVDLNKATVGELESLPQVGPVGAKKIIDARPYSSVDDIAKAGLSARAVEAIKPLVTASAPEPKAAAKKPAADMPKAKAKAGAPAGKLVDINSADEKTLETLPGVGPVLARAIKDGRPYKSIDDLERVKGLGPAKLAALKDHVTVGAAEEMPAEAATKGVAAKPAAGAKPAATKPAATKPAAGKLVNINTASKADLEALPGIGPVKAQAIIDARPFQKPEDIMKVKGIKEGIYGRVKDLITTE